jgi:DNA polymerase-3 subunit alpha
MQRHETHDPNADCTIFPHQQEVNKVLIELAHKHNIKLIATNDVHFVNADDAEAHDRLICLSTGKDLDDPKRMRYSKQEWMKTTAEMNTIFADIPEALSNTLEINRILLHRQRSYHADFRHSRGVRYRGVLPSEINRA